MKLCLKLTLGLDALQGWEGRKEEAEKLWIQDCRMTLVLNIPGVTSANDREPMADESQLSSLMSFLGLLQSCEGGAWKAQRPLC